MGQEYLGKGELYPLTPTSNGGVSLVSTGDLIKQSIQDILETPIGTHFPNEEYGSNLYLLVFIPNDSILRSLIIYFISEALFIWEKRVRVMNIECEPQDENKMNCRVTYRVLASNEIDSFIFPFYKEIKI